MAAAALLLTATMAAICLSHPSPIPLPSRPCSYVDRIRIDLQHDLMVLSGESHRDPDLIQLLSDLLSAISPWRMGDILTTMNRVIQTGELAHVSRMAQYLYDILDVAVPLSWRPENEAVKYGRLLTGIVIKTLKLSPREVQNWVDAGKTFLHQLVSVRDLPASDKVTCLIADMSRDVVSARDPNHRTALEIVAGLPLTLNSINLANHLQLRMHGDVLAQVWRTFITSSDDIPRWARLFVWYNTRLMDLLQYDLGQFLSDLAVPAAVRGTVHTATWLTMVWYRLHPRSLIPLVFAFRHQNRDLLQYYGVSTADDLLPIFYPEPFLSGEGVRQFLNHRPDSLSDQSLLLFSEPESDRSVFHCALLELSETTLPSPVWIQFAHDLSVIELRHCLIPIISLRNLLSQRAFVMKVVSSLIPNVENFHEMRFDQQITVMADHPVTDSVSGNVVMIAAQMVKEMALTRITLSLSVLYRLLANHSSLVMKQHQYIVKEAFDVVLEQLKERKGLSPIYSRMLTLLLNNDHLMGRVPASTSTTSSLSPIPLSASIEIMIRTLMKRLDSNALASCFIICPNSSHLLKIFTPDLQQKLSQSIAARLRCLAFDSVPNSLFTVAFAKDLADSSCGMCSMPNCSSSGSDVIDQSHPLSLRLVCGHVFHSSCLRQYLENSDPRCPSCQIALDFGKFRMPTREVPPTEMEIICALSRKRPRSEME